jgi:hypothetical protein
MIGIKMRAQEFIKEEKIGTSAKRPARKSDRPARGHAAESRYKVTADAQLDERGKASKELCLSNKKKGASDESSCKAQGFMARKTGKSQKIGKKRVKLDGKTVKSSKYGGPLPDYS